MKKNTNTTTASAKVNAKANEEKKNQILNAQKTILEQFVTELPIANEYAKAGAEKSLDGLMKYLYEEASKMKDGASVKVLYVSDDTVKNWIIDFYREGLNEKKSKPVATVGKPKVEKLVVAPKNTDANVSAKRIKPKAENEIYALSAKGFFVLCRAKSEAEAIELATNKAKKESGRQRLKLSVNCVASRVGAKAKANDVVTLHPAKTEADKTCFIYTDLEGKYGAIFAPDWDTAEQELCDIFVDQYDEFTDDIWDEIGNTMVFQS